MSDANPKDFVKGMAALVVSSNRLSEFHEKNLKMFPFVFFDQVSEVKIDYDVSVEHNVDVDKKNNITIKKPFKNCYVAYYLAINEDANKHQLARRFETLENSVRDLLWKNLAVKIFFNDKLVFESKK